MDEKFRESLMQVYESHKKRVLALKDPDQLAKATTDLQKIADLILKFDTASDTHDENVEKLLNSQENEELKRKQEMELAEFERKQKAEFEKEKREADEKRLWIDFWKDIGKFGLGVLVYGAVIVGAFYFDGKGVIFTSSAGRQVVSSTAKKVTDIFKV